MIKASVIVQLAIRCLLVAVCMLTRVLSYGLVKVGDSIVYAHVTNDVEAQSFNVFKNLTGE